ncbi:hypothetical protein ACFLU6_10045 [Acidobacteriota bacterium]
MGLFPFGRRRHFIVRRKLQERFTTILLLQMTVILLLIAGFAYYWNLKQEGFLIENMGTPDADVIHQNMQWFLFKIIFLIALSSVVLIVFGIYASHKIAGPIFKMQLFLSDIKNGNYHHEIRFRNSDRLEGLATVFNKAADTLQQSKAFKLEQIALAENKLSDVAVQLERPDAAVKDALPAVEDIRLLVERMEKGRS